MTTQNQILDMSEQFPPIYDQFILGSCHINAFCAVLHFELLRKFEAKLNKSDVKLNNYLSFLNPCCSVYIDPELTFKNNTIIPTDSKLFQMIKYGISKYYLYHYASAYFNDKNNPNLLADGGGSNQNSLMNAIKTYGILPTRSWEFSLAKQKQYFTYDPTNPTNQVVLDISTADIEWAKKFNNSLDIIDLISYKSKPTNSKPTDPKPTDPKPTDPKPTDPAYVELFKKHLDNSKPIIFSVDVANGWTSEYVLKTKSDTTATTSYHCMVIIGYDDNKGLFKLRNSWGAYVGDGGYFYIEYSTINESNIQNKLIIDAYIINEFKIPV